MVTVAPRLTWSFRLVLSALLVLPVQLSARDLGTRGPVYPIAEPDMLDEIEQILKAKKASGELDRLQEEAFRRMRSRAEEPLPVAGIVRAKSLRRFTWDPSVRFSEDIVNHQGQVVVPAGTMANPLRVVGLSQTLLFFDGHDARQVAWAKTFVDQAKVKVLPILVAGSPLALSRQWHTPVYFDQGGRLTTKLGIKAVPARAAQDGLLVQVEEFPVK